MTLPTKIARRSFLQTTGVSLGSMALSSLLSRDGIAVDTSVGKQVPKWTGVLNPTHFVPKAKRVIWLYMAGGMTHIDTFDNKPKLAELHGQPMPESITKGQQIATSLQTMGKIRPIDGGDLAQPRREMCRRHLHCEVAFHGRNQSRSRAHLYEYRHDDSRPTGDGIMVAVWARF